MSEEHRLVALLEYYQRSRRESMAIVERLSRSGIRQDVLTMNLASASGQMIAAALAEWRLGTGDPSPYLRDAVSDARRLVGYSDKVTGSSDRAFNMIAVRDAMYAQLLLADPIDREFRQASSITPEEKRQPEVYKQGWVHPWDTLVLELVETGNTPAEWEDFVAWLKNKGGGSNLLKTMQAYRQLIEAAKANDPKAAAKAVAAAEKCFKARRNLTETWGGGDLSDQTADHRLACAIRKAEQIRHGITKGVDTPHRWRW